ncbi:hypothetical protein Hanom_Chr02g00149981 [Helianthus anomalus]
MEAAVDSGRAMEQVETDIILEEEISETVVGDQNDQQVGGFNNDHVLDTVGINTEAPNNRGTKTRGFRKKARAQKSLSPPGQERPKKRAREGEDLFDIDRFIYAINGNEEKYREDIRSFVGIDENVGVATTNVEVVEEVIGVEVRETVKLGTTLSVE